jgi:hypothetical protein
MPEILEVRVSPRSRACSGEFIRLGLDIDPAVLDRHPAIADPCCIPPR